MDKHTVYYLQKEERLETTVTLNYISEMLKYHFDFVSYSLSYLLSVAHTLHV